MGEVAWLNDSLDLGTRLHGVGTVEQPHVIVACTIPRDAHLPALDPQVLAQALPDDVAVLVVPSHLTWELRERLGDELNVFNGAVRVFPIRRDGESYVAKRYLADDPDLLHRVTREASNAVASASHVTRPRSVPREPTPQPPPDARADDARPGVTVLTEPAEIERFAEHLLSPARTQPAVLVTRRAGGDAPWVDAEHIASDLAGTAEVYEMPTGAASWTLARALSDYPGAECYGGACRVYPPGLEWTADLQKAPLRFVFSPADGGRVSDQIIADALAAAFRSGYRLQAATGSRPVSGTVRGTAPGRGIVELDEGGYASIWPELTVADVAVEHLLRTGMRVTGSLDDATGRLDASRLVQPKRQAVAHYRAGDQVLGRVVSVEPDLCIVELYPDLQVAVAGSDVLETSIQFDLTQWLSVGETLRAVVRSVGEDDDEWELSVRDADAQAATLPAPALLPGGPPWLTPPDSAAYPAATEVPDTPRPAPEPSVVVEHEPPALRSVAVVDVDEVAALQAERDRLEVEVRRVREQVARLESRAGALRASLRDAVNERDRLKGRLAGADQVLREHDADLRAFQDPERQLRYEVELAWARRFPAAEKDQRPLAEYALGPEFLPTLQTIQGIDRSKVVDVVVEILTGLVHQTAGRQTHQLRSGPGGDDPYLTRPDGATCWRISLQHKTAQARRLHYWQLNDGTVELSSVRLHDDLRP